MLAADARDLRVGPAGAGRRRGGRASGIFASAGVSAGRGSPRRRACGAAADRLVGGAAARRGNRGRADPRWPSREPRRSISAAGSPASGMRLRARAAGRRRWRWSQPRCRSSSRAGSGSSGPALNPDMSQHLFAADRLADWGGGAPDRPGLSARPARAGRGADASSARASSRPSAGSRSRRGDRRPGAARRCWAWRSARRVVVALLVGFAYMAASYLIQGAFKETMQALFVLAFAIGLRAGRGALGGWRPARRALARCRSRRLQRARSMRTASPGSLWLLRRGRAPGVSRSWLPAARGGAWRAPAMLLRACRAGRAAPRRLAVAVAPELGRMVDFASFETFDPDGAGLGNLFNPISPLEALGDLAFRRLPPGPGRRVRAGHRSSGSARLVGARRARLRPLVVAAAAASARCRPPSPWPRVARTLYAAVAGTPYQEAKAIALAAPLAMLVSARALAMAAPSSRGAVRILRRRGIAELFPRSARVARARLAVGALARAFVAAAGASTVLALANGPVGPASWSPDLLELQAARPAPTLVLAPEDFLAGEHGRDFVVWELRGGEVCVEVDAGPSARAATARNRPGAGLRGIATGAVRGYRCRADVGDFTLWGIPDPAPGDSGCPFIADGARADPRAVSARRTRRSRRTPRR